MKSKSLRFSPLSALSIAALIILAGCAGSEYKIRSLAQLPQEHAFTSSNAGVSGSYTALNTNACNTYLGRNVLGKGYQPVFITITNNTLHSLRFDPSQISLPTVAADKVAQSVHLSTAGRAIGLGIACAPVALWAFFATAMTVPMAATAAILSVSALAGAVCLSPAVASSVNASRTNKNIDENFAAKALISQTIAPHETISGLIFVPKKEWNKNFAITLTSSLAKQVVLQS